MYRSILLMLPTRGCRSGFIVLIMPPAFTTDGADDGCCRHNRINAQDRSWGSEFSAGDEMLLLMMITTMMRRRILLMALMACDFQMLPVMLGIELIPDDRKPTSSCGPCPEPSPTPELLGPKPRTHP